MPSTTRCSSAAQGMGMEVADDRIRNGSGTLRSRTISAAISWASFSENWAIREAALAGGNCMRTTATF